jgi:DNA-binding NtrC family response regulator/tetratricopeptide (TPR) repeat protein
MARLFADRFLRCDKHHTLDLATGELVSLRITGAGTREQQRAWSDRCARLLGASHAEVLIDFGLVGRRLRFEAFRSTVSRRRALDEDSSPPSALVTQVVDWLNHDGSTCNVLRVKSVVDVRLEWLEILARALRIQGFVTVGFPMLQRGGEVLQQVAGRSVVALDSNCRNDLDGGVLSVSILKLFTARARTVAAVVMVPDRAAVAHTAAHAAERRPSYGPTRRGSVIVDSRATAWLDEGRRFLARGRHAAAERAFHAAQAAFDRRDDSLHSAHALMMLGRLLLTRGRAGEAEERFGAARRKFEDLDAASEALSACIYAGLAQTDDAKFENASINLRAAVTAAAALGQRQLIGTAIVAQARNLYWQRRWAEALRLLLSIDEPACPRYWSLAAKLHLSTGHLDVACQCAVRAREAASETADMELEAVVRTAQARVQGRLGDIDALCFHARAGLTAARAARRPLQALRIRLTLIEGLLDAGLLSRARAASRITGAFNRTALPMLLKRRVEELVPRLAEGSPPQRTRTTIAMAHETAAVFLPDHSEAVTQLLSACQAGDDERTALKSIAEIVRKQTGAAAVGIFGAGDTGAVQHAMVGALEPTIARRCLEMGQPVHPETGSGGVEAAAPILHLGRTIGSVACRWTVEGPHTSQDVLTFPRIAAAACAPLLQILVERQIAIAQGPADESELIGISTAIQDVRRSIVRAANAPFAVLIEGESGAGKELVARAIHRAGYRRDKPLRTVNCAALTEELVDSELFGHAKGAFTGAVADRLGLFESAEDGTVFLDEVGELSARAQAKLLRVLQEGEIRRIGENFTRPVSSRLIAASNRTLADEVGAGRFRQDLLYRLDVIRITVPPLRERVEDIPLLAARFWRDAVGRVGSKAVLGQAALAALARYHWPGNVREMQNVLASLAVSVPPRGVVPASAMPPAIAHALKIDPRETLETARRRFEERFVRAALARAAGHRGQTASALGVSRQGLAKLLQRLQLP